jgi:hypothetical protein
MVCVNGSDVADEEAGAVMLSMVVLTIKRCRNYSEIIGFLQD